jgi:DNA-binding CsgD family transcriptional regulator
MKTAAMPSSSISAHARAAHEGASHPQLASNALGGPRQADAPGLRLTPRQLEVLALLCEGLPNKLICRRLSISAGTVKAHISSILRELGVASRLQAVVAARRSGLIGEPGVGSATLSQTQPRVSTASPGATVTALDFGQRATYRATLIQQRP